MKEAKEVRNFLENHLNLQIGDLAEIFGGKHSRAFSYSVRGNRYVIRINIVLYGPDRRESSRSALAFYEDKGYENYKEKILFGVYYTMLHNYAIAVKMGMEASCQSSSSRVRELEGFLANK